MMTCKFVIFGNLSWMDWKNDSFQIPKSALYQFTNWSLFVRVLPASTVQKSFAFLGCCKFSYWDSCSCPFLHLCCQLHRFLHAFPITAVSSCWRFYCTKYFCGSLFVLVCAPEYEQRIRMHFKTANLVPPKYKISYFYI